MKFNHSSNANARRHAVLEQQIRDPPAMQVYQMYKNNGRDKRLSSDKGTRSS